MAINSVGHSTSFIAQLQKSAGVSNQNNKVQKTLKNATAGTEKKNSNTLGKAAEVQQQANTATVKKTVNKYA